MSISAVLDIFIGLAFTFLILSLLTAEIQEQISALMDFRARHLKKSIELLLRDLQYIEKGKTGCWVIFEENNLKTVSKETYREETTQLVLRDPQDPLGGIMEVWSVNKETNVKIEEFKNKSDDSSAPKEYTSISKDIVLIPERFEDNLKNDNEIEALIDKNKKYIEKVKPGTNGSVTLKWTPIKVESITDHLYNQTAICDLSQYDSGFSITNWIKRWLLSRQNNLRVGPSYIPAHIFATSIFEVINKVLPDIHKLKRGVDDADSFIEKVKVLPFSDDVKDQIIFLVERVKLTSDLNGIGGIQENESGGESAQESGGKAGLLQPANHSSSSMDNKNISDLKSIHNELSKWFEQSMQHSSGVYKRYAKGLSLLLGLIIAIFLNINAFNIVDALQNQEVRSALIESSANVLKDDDLISQCIENNSDPTVAKIDCQEKVENLSKELQANIPVSLGWGADKNLDDLINQLGQSFFGWMITAIAIALGAPFWFDTLDNLVNVRNANKKGESLIESIRTPK